jgi:hypothetical protein
MEQTMHSEARVRQSLDVIRKASQVSPLKISQERRQLLMACGLTAGQIYQLSKGVAEPELFILTHATGVQRQNANDGGETAQAYLRKLTKSFGGYKSLVGTMLRKGYDKAGVMRVLDLTEEEFEAFLQD